MDAVKTDDGYVMVSGWPDIWLTKIDGHGNIIWQKRISSGHWEVPKSIVRADDGYAIVGDIGLDKTDAFLIKTDENGNILWKKTYGDKNLYEFERRIIKAADGFLLIGEKEKKIAEGSIWIIKTDENGTEIWNKTYSRGAYEGSARIIKIEDGYLIGGWGDPGSYFLKVDNEGNKIWYCNYLGRDPTFIDIAEADDGYIGAGYTYTKTVGSSDIWLLKVNKSRGDKVIWMKNFGGRGDDGARKIFVENNSYILLGNEETEKDVFKGVIIKCGDYKPPEINITRPRPNYLYVFDREIMPYGYTMAIGKITVVVNVTNPSGAEINRVEFYIQKNKYTYEPSKVVYSPPYEWTVDIPVVGWIELTAGLYYGGCDGVAAASMEMRILKLM